MSIPSFHSPLDTELDSTTYDVSEFGSLVEAEYSKTWGCVNSVFLGLSDAALAEVDGLDTAFTRLKNPYRLDSTGISIALPFLFLPCGDQFVQFEWLMH